MAAQLGWKAPPPKPRKAEVFKPKPVPAARILPRTGRSPEKPWTEDELEAMAKVPLPGQIEAMGGKKLEGNG